MARPMNGRTMPRCRSSRSASRWRSAASRWSPRRRRTSRTRATRGRARRTTRRRSSTRSIPATRRRTTTCASRTSRSTARTRQPRIPAAYFPLPALRRRGRRRGRIGIGRAALPRPADQPQPSHDARDRLPGAGRALPGRRRRRGDPRAELPGLPPERQPRRPRAGGERHRHRGHGLRQGHRRICRRAALPVLRLPARQCGRAARTTRQSQALTLELALRLLEHGAGRAHHRAVAAALERQSPTGSSTIATSSGCRRRDRPPPRRFRQAEGGGEGSPVGIDAILHTDVSPLRSGGETRNSRVQRMLRVRGPAPMSARALAVAKSFQRLCAQPLTPPHSLDANVASLSRKGRGVTLIYFTAADCIAGGVDGGFGFADASSSCPPAISSSSSLRFSASPKSA